MRHLSHRFLLVTLCSLFLLALAPLALAACGGNADEYRSRPNTVTMDAGSFLTTSLTIKKGSTITFINDPQRGSLHILIVGKDGQENSEAGAADLGGISGHRIDTGDGWTTPPWTTAGTYHIACTIHPRMNLLVTVTG